MTTNLTITKEQAYEHFLGKLKARLFRVLDELDSELNLAQLNLTQSPRYIALSEEQLKIQAALSALDDIANLT